MAQIGITAYLGLYTINLIKNKTTTDGLENDSAAQTIVLAARPDAPDGKNFPATRRVKAVRPAPSKFRPAMSITMRSTSKWIAGGDNVFIVTKPGVYFSIRTSAVTNAPASQSLSVSVPTYKQATPNAKVNYKDNVISGFKEGEPYSIEVNSVVTIVNADSNGQIDISKYYGSTILLRKSAQQMTKAMLRAIHKRSLWRMLMVHLTRRAGSRVLRRL
jgi:hypothetical protein